MRTRPGSEQNAPRGPSCTTADRRFRSLGVPAETGKRPAVIINLTLPKLKNIVIITDDNEATVAALN